VDSELSGSISVLVSALLEIYGKLSASTIQLMREKMARLRTEDELHRLQQEQIKEALDNQASEYQIQLEALAFEDPLTGLLNRNGIVQALRKQLQGIGQSGSGWSGAVVAIDLDDFVMINATLGEDTADYFLKLLTRRWLDSIPSPEQGAMSLYCYYQIRAK
jgi:GGDEF domain-containing protein